jgi:acid phosphatase (class A)
MTAVLAAVGAAGLLSSCGDRGRQQRSTTPPASRYLTDQSMPDVLAMLPPPPAQGSAGMARDEEVRRAALALRATPRYALAVADANRDQDATDKAFQCALGVPIGPDATPVLNGLLARLRIDVRAATYRVKGHYKRVRPWVAHHTRPCTQSEELVRDDGSYPSARGAVGWAYALVLAELSPGRRAIILDRGREFGESRIVCDAEWRSDVDSGRTVGAAIVAQLDRAAKFQSDLAAAGAEVKTAMAEHRKPHCAGR